MHDKKYFTDKYREWVVSSVDGELQIEILNFELQNTTLQATIISTPGWTPVYGWIYNQTTSDWYFLLQSEIARKQNDLILIKKLLKEIVFNKSD